MNISFEKKRVLVTGASRGTLCTILRSCLVFNAIKGEDTAGSMVAQYPLLNRVAFATVNIITIA